MSYEDPPFSDREWAGLILTILAIVVGLVLLIVFVPGCVVAPAPVTLLRPPAPRAVQVQVTPDGVLQAGTYSLEVDPPFGPQSCVVQGVALTCFLASNVTPPYGAHLKVAADTFDPVALDFVLTGEATQTLAPIALTPSHVDPSTLPLGELARIRGAMWPRACPGLVLPYGPRPNQEGNIIAVPYLEAAYTPAQQDAILDCLVNGYHYTNVVLGPTDGTPSYHGLWPSVNYTTDEGFERFLDLHQRLWDRGLRPVDFWHGDGQTYEQTEAQFAPLIARHPRAQRLVRISIMSGWEPTRYDWSSCTWARYVALGVRLFPNAVQGIHTVSDVDAPVGEDALCGADGNGKGWQRLADAGLHLWFIQNGPYAAGPSDDPTLARSFAAQFQNNADGAAAHGVVWHFRNRIDSWPGNSAWGPTVPICPVAAEQTAYEATWNNRPPEAGREAWGNLAVTAPGSDACGYLDGGTVDVPRRR